MFHEATSFRGSLVRVSGSEFRPKVTCPAGTSLQEIGSLDRQDEPPSLHRCSAGLLYSQFFRCFKGRRGPKTPAESRDRISSSATRWKQNPRELPPGSSKRGSLKTTRWRSTRQPRWRLIRQETRVRGLTAHCRRDPRNAKEVGRTVRDLFCTGAQEVGKRCLVRRLRSFHPSGLGGSRPSVCVTPAALQTQNHAHSDTRRDGCHALHRILSSAHTYTRATARRVSFLPSCVLK